MTDEQKELERKRRAAISRVIREARAAVPNLTQRQVAAVLGERVTTYVKWESGERLLRLYDVPALAAAFGISPVTLVKRMWAAITEATK